MKITILRPQPGHDVEVWASLVDGNPLAMSESFIIGTGATVDQAVTAALGELDAARRELEATRTMAKNFMGHERRSGTDRRGART
jgi:hypothetical protein